MVARMVRDHEAASSSLATPTINQARNAVKAFRAVLRPRLPAQVDGQRGFSAETFTIRRRGGLPRPPGVGGRKTSVRPPKWCAGCARGIEYVWRRTLPCAPWETPSQSATPNVRNHPTPAIPQPRGVEDAAPYGRVRNEGVSIVVNRRGNAASLLPPLGSPERGAVAPLCAVTEGLVQRGCGAITSFVNPRNHPP